MNHHINAVHNIGDLIWILVLINPHGINSPYMYIYIQLHIVICVLIIYSYGGFQKWGYPNSQMIFVRGNPNLKWMKTRATPMTMETSIYIYISLIIYSYIYIYLYIVTYSYIQLYVYYDIFIYIYITNNIYITPRSSAA